MEEVPAEQPQQQQQQQQPQQQQQQQQQQPQQQQQQPQQQQQQQQQQADGGVESVTAVDSSLTEPSSCGSDSVNPVNDLVKGSDVSRGQSSRGRSSRGSRARGTHSNASRRAHRSDQGDSGTEVAESHTDLARTSKGRDSNAEALSQQHSRPVKTVVCDDHDNSTVRSVKQSGDSLVIRINCSSSSTTGVGHSVTSDGQVKVKLPAAATAAAKLDSGGSTPSAAVVSSFEQSHDTGADSQTAIADDKRMNADGFASNRTPENRRPRGGGKFGRMNHHRGQRGDSITAAPANLAEGPIAATAGDEEVQQKTSEHSATGTPDVRKSENHGISSRQQQIELDSQFRSDDTSPASGGTSRSRGRHRGRGFSTGRRNLRSATPRGRGIFRGAYGRGDSDMLPGAIIESPETRQTATVDDVRADCTSANDGEIWNDDQRKLSDKPDCVDVSSVAKLSNDRERPSDDVVSMSRGRCYDARYFVRSRRARGAYRGRRAGNVRPFSRSQASAATVGQDGGPAQGHVIVGGEEDWDAETISVVTVSTVSSGVKEDGLAAELNALSINASECKEQGVQGNSLTNIRAECVGDSGKSE